MLIIGEKINTTSKEAKEIVARKDTKARKSLFEAIIGDRLVKKGSLCKVNLGEESRWSSKFTH